MVDAFTWSAFFLNWFSTIFWVTLSLALILTIKNKIFRTSLCLLLLIATSILCIGTHLESGANPEMQEAILMQRLEEIGPLNIHRIQESLSTEKKDALTIASENGYSVLGVEVEVAGKKRRVIVLGETHYKSEQIESYSGRQVVDLFDHIGVEGFSPSEQWFERLYNLLWFAYDWPLDVLAETSPTIDPSTIVYAAEKAECEVSDYRREALEKGHLATQQRCKQINSKRTLVQLEAGPLDDYDQAYDQIPDPNKTIILDKRNLRMVANIKKYFVAMPEKDELLVIVGMLHVPGILDLLGSP